MNLFTAHGLLAPYCGQTGDDASSGFNKESIHVPCDSSHKTPFGGLGMMVEAIIGFCVLCFLLPFVKSHRLITSKPTLL